MSWFYIVYFLHLLAIVPLKFFIVLPNIKGLFLCLIKNLLTVVNIVENDTNIRNKTKPKPTLVFAKFFF